MTFLPEEYREAIDDKIMLDVEISVLQNMIQKAENEGKDSYKNYLEQILKSSLNKRMELGKYLKKNGIKISEPKRTCDMFIEYYYSININGGYKDGYSRYWDKGIKFRLQKRLNKYFKKDGMNE